MRIDKYIWAIRVAKTRTMASSLCRDGKVIVDGKKVKAAKILKEGEEFTIRKGAVFHSYKVLAFPKSRVGASLVLEYSQDITPQEQLDKIEMIRLANIDRPNGVGRPTKKDRRNWAKSTDYD